MHLTEEEIRTALEAVLASPEFGQSPRLCRFLRFVVEKTIAGEGTTLKETVVGMDVFDRGADYDPKIDPVVRVQARRMRLKLMEYYSGAGGNAQVRIVLPKGTYQPRFEKVPPAPAAEEASTDVPAVAQAKPVRGWRMPAAVLAALALVVSAAAWMYTRPALRTGTQSTAPRLISGHQGYSRSPTFSPDGEWIVFSRQLSMHGSALQIQSAGGGAVRALTNGESYDYEPAWSPDGKFIAFLRQLERNRFAIVICPVGQGTTAERQIGEVALRSPIDWSANGRSIVAADRDDASSPSAILSVGVDDGRKRQITSPPKGVLGDSMPRISPDGSMLGFVRSKEASVQDIYVAPVSGGEPRRLTQQNSPVEGLSWHPKARYLIASMRLDSETRSLWRVFPSGQPPERVAESGIDPIFPALAPRGEKLAYVVRFSDTNIWRARLTASGATAARALTSSLQLDTGPQISPDGTFISWRSNSSGSDEVWIARADGKDARKLTHMKGPTTGSAHWSPDGQWIVFDSRPNSNGDIFLVPAAGGTPTALTRDPSNEVLPSFSRDGRWIYFSTDRAGLWEIWRMSRDGKESKRIVGSGGYAATESPDGRWLYYTRQAGGESGIWRIPTEGGAEEKLTAELTANFWGQWAVSSHALYYGVYPPPGTRRAIRRLDLATRVIRDVLTLAKMPVQFDSGMAIAADESWIYWSQLDAAGSEIYVVDGFR